MCPHPGDLLKRLQAAQQRAKVLASTVSDSPVDDAHPLVVAFGLDRAKALLGVARVERERRWSERRAHVAMRSAEGATLAEIADELGVTPSRIWQIKRALGL